MDQLRSASDVYDKVLQTTKVLITLTHSHAMRIKFIWMMLVIIALQKYLKYIKWICQLSF